MVGTMEMPDGFKYKDVFLRGKPHHGKFDYFLARHPKMSIEHRAKIFSPYESLKGFRELINSQG